MLNKQEVLEHLRNAKKAHLKWVQRAEALIEGQPVQKEQLPVDCHECAFGEWFYSEGQRLDIIPNMGCLKEIELLHEDLHAAYMKIFEIYFAETPTSFFAKLLGKKKKISEQDLVIAKHYYAQLKEISEKLIKEIERLDRRLSALQSDVFAEV